MKAAALAIWYRLIIFWVMSIVIAGLIFAMTFSERKREFGILRSIGASRNYLIRLSMSEIFMISAFGSVLGLCLGGVVILIANPLIIKTLNLPFLLPG